jgi:hypothetical protein
MFCRTTTDTVHEHEANASESQNQGDSVFQLGMHGLRRTGFRQYEQRNCPDLRTHICGNELRPSVRSHVLFDSAAALAPATSARSEQSAAAPLPDLRCQGIETPTTYQLGHAWFRRTLTKHWPPAARLLGDREQSALRAGCNICRGCQPNSLGHGSGNFDDDSARVAQHAPTRHNGER